MTGAQVLQLGQDLLYTALLLALPALLTGMIVGLVLAIMQTVTSIQEQSLTFVPRLIAVGLVLVFTMGWSMQLAVHFTVRMISSAAELVRY
jgi:flagellar biosynthesis protein FliQ